MFCQIGDPCAMEAILVIEQADMAFVAQEQSVDMKLDELPAETFKGRISEVAKADMKTLPQHLSHRGGSDVESKVDPQTGQEHPLTALFQARVPLTVEEGILRIGLRGHAKIYTAWQPATTQLWYWFIHTFNFKM